MRLSVKFRSQIVPLAAPNILARFVESCLASFIESVKSAFELNIRIIFVAQSEIALPLAESLGLSRSQ